MGHLPALDISKGQEVFVEIVHLYHCDDKKKRWSEESNKQFTGLEYLQADILLSGREGMRSAVRKTRRPQKFPSQDIVLNVYTRDNYLLYSLHYIYMAVPLDDDCFIRSMHFLQVYLIQLSFNLVIQLIM